MNLRQQQATRLQLVLIVLGLSLPLIALFLLGYCV